MALNLALADLPDLLALPRPTTLQGMAVRLDARYSKCLEIAENTLAMAQTLIERDDLAAATDLFAEAREYVLEARAIQALRS